MDRPAIYTDYYELTMAQGYYLEGRAGEIASYDYFFRDFPFKGGYVVFAGLSDLIDLLLNFQFKEDELQYLREAGFVGSFIEYLRNLNLSLKIEAPREGEIIFPLEPIVNVRGSIIEAQIIETMLLNILNFESLIATKAMRIKYTAGDSKILDFGLRRAQGYGGILATRASFIGGVEATSNVIAGFTYDLPVSGTMAHSWIQSYEDELTAFRTYARHYPDSCTLLVDTYDTLKSGVPNAITVGRELKDKGHQLKAIRLDSGDLAYLSKRARTMLDEAGLHEVKIAVSNQLDEYLIKSLLSQNAPIDLFGVGTRLVTGNETPALDGVYKLSEVNGEATLKISENIEKTTLPGEKKTIRYFNDMGEYVGDGILLDEEVSIDTIYHPYMHATSKDVSRYNSTPLLHTVMENGKIVVDLPSIEESAEYAGEQFARFDEEYKRFENPHVYKVGISKKLKSLRKTLLNRKKNRIQV